MRSAKGFASHISLQPPRSSRPKAGLGKRPAARILKVRGISALHVPGEQRKVRQMKLKASSMRIGVVGMAVLSLSLAGLSGCGSSSGESASSAGPDIAKIADPAERAIEAVRQADRQIKSKDIS